MSTLLIYFIFSKINIEEIKAILSKSIIGYLVLALLFFVVSKAIAALRVQLYFRQLNIPLSHKNNFKLALLGMFYNLFLPGGIGGDAYKGYVLKKTFQVNTKNLVSVLVLDRLSGLLVLCIYALILIVSLKLEFVSSFTGLLLGSIPVLILLFWWLHKKFFSYVLRVFWKSFFLSTLVQLSQLISVWCILLSLNIALDRLAYLALFLISSIVAVIPLTLGGIGSREVTFYYGATLLGLQQDTSVGISLLFFLITAVVSLAGVWFHFKKINLEDTTTLG